LRFGSLGGEHVRYRRGHIEYGSGRRAETLSSPDLELRQRAAMLRPPSAGVSAPAFIHYEYTQPLCTIAVSSAMYDIVERLYLYSGVIQLSHAQTFLQKHWLLKGMGGWEGGSERQGHK
jgi:hypothetical protein